MRIVIASNAFKESMTSVEAAEAIAAGFRRAMGKVSASLVPIADGGDGTLDAIGASMPSRRIRKKVGDPLGRTITAEYLIDVKGETAVVEMAKASGLALLKMNERNPIKTSTFGTGQLIAGALESGATKIIAGIGGSATNDGGAGIASALGYKFIGRNGKELKPCGGDLAELERIDATGIHKRLKDVKILVACDVTNPLLGQRGATAVYSRQKGATPARMIKLERSLERLSEIVERDMGIFVKDSPGAGAAGGAGYGLMVFAGAKLKPGIALMADITGLDEKIRDADLVITGEGRMDSQSAQGKAPFGILKIAKKHRVPIIAFCGSVDGEESLSKTGFGAIIPIVDRPMTLEAAISGGRALLEAAAYRSALLMKTGKLLNK